MKKQIALAAGLAVLAAPAFASKARLQALGEDVNGSFYVNDNRNVFLNVAEVNNHKDLVTFEWGAADADDDTAAPRAEGGFFRSHGNMVYGVQLGRVSSLQQLKNDSGTGFAGTLDANNNIDLFVGGDAGIKWGATLSYVSEKDDANDDKASGMDLALGVSQGNLSGYLKYGLAGTLETTGEELERKGAMEVGGSYLLNDYTLFAQYSTAKLESDAAGDTDDYEATSMMIGAGRATKLNDKATLFTRVSYMNVSETDDMTASDEELKTSLVPVVIGLEYDAASWLTLRGSVSQAIWSNSELDGDKSTVANSTVVNAGASLKFGDLTVDGVIGNNVDGATPGNNGTSTGEGQLRTDSLMSRVSVSYRF
jgi:hypothetical protein